ncbi:hypothetical protein Chor_003183 [Crotalus horridus]
MQIVFMTLTLFPIRLFFAAFMMLLAWPFAFIASIGPAEKQLENPLSWWRKIIDILLKAIMRTMWLAGGFHWINVKGRRALPTEAAILTLAPHSSYFDAIPVTMTMASIVMKAESKDIPVWGRSYLGFENLSTSPLVAHFKIIGICIINRAKNVLNHFKDHYSTQIMIFPEGTCTNRSCLITFKPGAFIPGVPVQPVILRYPNKLDTITWTWQGPGALTILWLTLCQFHNFVEIEFLPVYIPSEEEKKNPSLYANNVRRLMAELKPEKLEKEFDAYSERARKLKNKKVTLKEFAEYLEIQVSDMLGNMFALFEEKEDGLIDIREYVTALSVVCRPSKTLQTMQLAFKAKTGGITEQDLTSILKSVMGVPDLNVSNLFKAIDDKEKGEIVYDDFHYFTETFPNFAEEYLYPDQVESKHYLETPAPNGFCADFSPEITENRRNSLQKKMN